jgi:GNAT superfamily N-acetyltransferase
VAAADAPPKLQVKAVTPARWADFEQLFEARGSPGYCYCMAWRASSKDPGSGTRAGRKSMMKRGIELGVPVGLLGYLDQQPVAWCSLAPFDTFRGLRKPDEATDKVWSITCFFVRREHRGQGLTRQLLDAAVHHAKKHGATRLEGYPVDPDSPSYRYMGFVSLFKDAGFKQIGREGTRRHVVQLATGRPSRAKKV